MELTENELLKLRISVIFVKDKLTFINPISEFRSKINQRFKVDYSLDKIEDALNDLEEVFLNESNGVIEIPEDFELK